jgi:ribose 5-phosphate isomerase A
LSDKPGKDKISIQDRLKKEAGISAVDFVESGMVLGLGTGSTAKFAVEEIGLRLKDGRLKDIVGIPSSIETEKRAREHGIPIITFDERQEIDLTIDGADEVDPDLNLIKGGGGALLREKVLAQSSSRNVMIVDESKLTPVLGTHWPVPIEVIPFAWRPVANFLKSLGAEPVLRMESKESPYTTDQNNYIIDAHFGPISNPDELGIRLAQKAGVVEYGLFLGTASEVIVATSHGIRYQKRKDS